MHFTYSSIKTWLSFILEQNPGVEKTRNDFRKFIPEPYDGVVIISADFELAWGWRFDKKSPGPVKESIKHARKERNNVPKILELSEEFNIPLTWGTVGHLFLDKCQANEKRPHSEIERLPYFENEWWKFSSGDWFDDDPCSTLEEAPEWYAPDLIGQILASKVEHEIASHSFSHISCEEKICTPGALKDELFASQLAANFFDIKLESFIFPGHTMGNYNTLWESGYTSMRTNFKNTLGYPVHHSNGIWEHKTTMELSNNPLFTVSQNLFRFKKIVDKCIKKHMVCNFWFHPSFDEISIDTILPGVYNILNSSRMKLWITTMKEYTAWLNSQQR